MTDFILGFGVGLIVMNIAILIDRKLKWGWFREEEEKK